MRPAIIHAPYDLGLGFDLGVGCSIRVSAFCLMEWCEQRLNLFWELIGADKPILLIEFDVALVARVLDEFWHSVETDHTRWKGIDGSFARTVEGSEYPTDPGVLKDVHPKATYFQFVTGSDCVDVISIIAPRAKLIGVEEIAQYRLQFPLRH